MTSFRKFIEEAIDDNKVLVPRKSYKEYLKLLGNTKMGGTIDFDYIDNKSQKYWQKNLYFAVLDIIHNKYVSKDYNKKQLLNYFSEDFKDELSPTISLDIQNGIIKSIIASFTLNGNPIVAKLSDINGKLKDNWVYSIGNAKEMKPYQAKAYLTKLLYNPIEKDKEEIERVEKEIEDTNNKKIKDTEDLTKKYTLEYLEKLLKNHDWTYYMADRQSDVSAGRKSENEIIKVGKFLVNSDKAKEARELYKKYKKSRNN